MNSLPSTHLVPLPKHLTPGLIARLARDVVMELKAIEDILAPYCISLLQYERVKELPFFKRVQEDFAVEWNRVSSTQERLKLISAVMLEEGLPRLGSQMVDKDVSPTVAVETGKFFARLAGVGEGKAETASGEKFVINISLGDDTKLQFTKDAVPGTAREEPSVVAEVESQPEGPEMVEGVVDESTWKSGETEMETVSSGEIR